MIIDTHLHLIYRNKLSYPWLAEVAALDHDASYESYHATAQQLGISGALHMEVDVADKDRDAETSHISSLMSEPGSLLKGAIASCRPEHSDFPAWLEQQQPRDIVKGLRRVLHTVDDSISTTALFRDNVKRLSSTRLTFDLCVLPQQMPLAMELIDWCPDVMFVIDHCGVPDIKTGTMDPWREHMTSLAQRHNVIVKVSGVMAYADGQNWTLDDLRPYVEHTINTFGWKRVVWGSDSPVCTLGGSLATWVAATHALIDGCSEEEKAQLLFENASRVWQLDEQTRDES